MGFDRSMFITPVHKELICSICYDVFEKPVFLPLCRHVFCSDCISQWMSQTNQAGNKCCPIDKTQIKISKEEVLKKKISYNLSNIISDSIVMCKYRERGCMATFSLQAFCDHVKSCKYKRDSTEATSVGCSTSSDLANASTDSTTITSNNATSAANSTAPAEKATKSTSSKSKPNLCKMSHPFKNNNKTYSHPRWSGDTKLIKLVIRSVALSYSAYSIASYIKNQVNVDVYCVHIEMEFPSSLTKDLAVFIAEADLDKVLTPIIWPNKVSVMVNLDHKQILVKGSLKTLRKQNFYGFNERNEDKKQWQEAKKKKRQAQIAEGATAGKPKKRRGKNRAAKKAQDSSESISVASVALKATATNEKMDLSKSNVSA